MSTVPAGGARLPGPLLFVRYAYPPNALGYCGPPDSAAFRAYGLADTVDPELVRLARSFTGAWPYLELIADRAGIPDPLDHRVVEAYWIGNRLLFAAELADLADPVGERFRDHLGLRIGGPAEDALPHHSFHVLCVYPWAGMLGDPRKAAHALSVLDQCRIRWGRVTAVQGERMTVRSRPLTWDGRRLGLGEPVTQPVETSVADPTDPTDPTDPIRQPAVGDWVSLHWNWACSRLSERQVRALRIATRRHLEQVNRRLGGQDPATGSGHRDRTELSGHAGRSAAGGP